MATHYLVVEGPHPTNASTTDASDQAEPEDIWKTVTDANKPGWVRKRIHGVKSLAAALDDSTEKIVRLDIAGHGSPRQMSLGASYVATLPGLDASWATHRELLRKRDRFDAASVVRFIGCDTGSFATYENVVIDGRTMLFALASTLGCKVIGIAGQIKSADFATGEYVLSSTCKEVLTTPKSVGPPTAAPVVPFSGGTPTTPEWSGRIAAIDVAPQLHTNIQPKELLRAFDRTKEYTATLRSLACPLASVTLPKPNEPGTSLKITLYGAGHAVQLVEKKGQQVIARTWLARRPNSSPRELAAWTPLLD